MENPRICPICYAFHHKYPVVCHDYISSIIENWNTWPSKKLSKSQQGVRKRDFSLYKQMEEHLNYLRGVETRKRE